MSKKTLVVIGNGMVGAKFCEKLVSSGYTSKHSVTVFGEEPRPAYNRVRLSSYVLNREPSRLELLPAEWYEENGIELKTGTRISSLNPGEKTVTDDKVDAGYEWEASLPKEVVDDEGWTEEGSLAKFMVSLDGDSDRVILCDEKGKIIDGDQIIAMLAKRWKIKKILKGGVIGTLMSNYGLQKYLKKQKIKFIRANVGDRYVKEKMQKNKFNLGGEQSGHIILGKFATTGDGLLVALEVLFSMRKGKKASELFNLFKLTPQILENINVKDKSIINSSKCKKAIRVASKLIKNKGRMLVRKSGTEPKIRIMGESEDDKLLVKCINIVKKSIK